MRQTNNLNNIPMKKNMKQKLLLLTIGMMGFCPILYPQSVYKINDSKDNDMKLSGTSTLHDWTMNAKSCSGSAQFNVTGVILKKINALTFSLPVQNLKSNENALDKNAYEALKSDQYKDILFKLTSASVGPQQNNKYPIKAIGNLSIAGITKTITMDISCLVNPDKSIACQGSEKLKMTDFQVKPPTFLLGAMKTGDDIALDFNLIFEK
jgi:hypothetical protein